MSEPKSFFFFKGRVALYAILKSIGISAEDEIIIPGFTCIAVPNAITYLGAKPIYAEIDPATYNLDPSRIEEKVSPRTKAVIAQHTFGIPVDMDEILAIADKYGMTVIEDCCHAIGSRYKGRLTGTLGDAAFFSSQWSKPITTGLGGWAVANDPKIAENLELLLRDFYEPGRSETMRLKLQYLLFSHFLNPSLFWFAQNAYRMLSKHRLAVGSNTCEELKCELPKDYEKLMSPWQKELLNKKLEDIEKIISHRKSITGIYRDLLRNKGEHVAELPEYCDEVLLRFPLEIANKNDLLEKAKRNRIELGDWFMSPVHPNLEAWEKVSYEEGMCPVAEWVCKRIINLPTHAGISRGEAEKIFAFVFGNKK